VYGFAMQLAPDATIADVVPTLEEPDAYVRQALQNLHQEAKKEPKSVITIGITGKGKFPNYKIDVPGDHLGLDMVYNAPVKVFSGRTHEIINDPDKVRGENWSAKSLSLDQLRNILGEIRKR
jgi:hypothetical protein